MPNDTFGFTLFDNTALSGWTYPAPSTAADMCAFDAADDDDDTVPPEAAPAAPAARGSNFHLAGDRDLALGWPARARDNIAAIRLSKALELSGRAPTVQAPSRAGLPRCCRVPGPANPG